jgi:hypothetical protein
MTRGVDESFGTSGAGVYSAPHVLVVALVGYVEAGVGNTL